MKHKLISLLLLTLVLPASAAEIDQLIAMQSVAPAPAELAPAATPGKQEQDVEPATAEAPVKEDDAASAESAVEPPDSTLSSLRKAFDGFFSVLPKFGFDSDGKQNEASAKNQNEKGDLNAAIRKFAAMPKMRSAIVLIYDEKDQRALHSKNANVVTPIASITKLMTAMVVLDAKLPLDEEISISSSDINRQKRTRSRTRAGMTMTRGELLKLALMASDNLSAAALARTYPGGTAAALEQMNAKARELGMHSARFMDPTGLHSGNVANAHDLVKMVQAAKSYELIHKFSTSTSHTIERAGHRPMRFHNTNPLVKNASWDIGLSKTGYISEAGRCLVMEAKISENPVIIVLLDSWGRNSRVGDANRVKKWMEKATQNTRDL